MKKIGIFLAILFLTVNLFSQSFDLIPNKSPDETRILKILIVADQGYREQIPDWQEEITFTVSLSSIFLEQQVGIKLEIVELGEWQRNTDGFKGNLEIILDELKLDYPRTRNAHFDVVIGFTSHYLGKAYYLKGAQAGAKSYSGYIVISNKKPWIYLDKYGDLNSYNYVLLSPAERQARFPSLILHELGHLFDCKNREGSSSAMAIGGYEIVFCEEDIQLIKKNKWRKFPLVPDNNL